MEGGRGEPGLPAQMARKRQRVGCSDEGAEDVELGGEPLLEDMTLQMKMFNLELRPHKAADWDQEWCVQAKARAARIRFGIENAIMWWGADKVDYPLENVRLKADTGVHDFQIEAAVCERLRAFLADPSNYDADGYMKMAGTQFPGYSGYPYVHAPGGHVAAAQEKRTTRVHGRQEVNLVLKEVQQVWDLVQAVRHALGMPVPDKGSLQSAGKALLALHFLTQDESQQALFSWHSDAEDLQGLGRRALSDMTTVIVGLSHECSGMRIWGCAPVLYRAQGDAVVFPGGALHESLPRCTASPAGGAVYKVALFFN